LALSLLNYLPVGDGIKVSYGTYRKISEELIYIDIDLDKREMLDTVEQSGLINLPI